MNSITRRRFIQSGAAALGAAVAAPSIVPSSALGKDGAVAPSERITLGVIGYGNRCKVVLQHFMTFPEVRTLAICDARRNRREGGKAAVDKQDNNHDCETYGRIPEILARDDIDAILIATGDRMHAVGSIAAARAGKDVYSEKPMTLTIAEGRALVETFDRFGAIYQCGHQRRSVDSYRFQREVVRNGIIGNVHTCIARDWAGPVVKPQKPEPVPDGFDYEAWLGPTPWHPYNPARINGWNYFWDTGGGVLAAMGCHYTDLAQWCFDADDTGPLEFTGTATYDDNSMADAPITCEAIATYANGAKLIHQAQGLFADRFIRFIGDEGWIQVDDGTNVITAEPKSILKMRAIAAAGWGDPGGHVRNFLDGVRTRRKTICHPESAHRATTVCHASNVCLRLGRDVKWNPETERFANDDEANRMISRAMRPPWTL